jgi:hypothetical protein
MADKLKCDLCGAPATTVHLLPSIESVESVSLSGECACDPGGYRFPIHQWTEGPLAWGHPTRRYNMRRHLEHTRPDNPKALALVDRRLGLS